MLLYPASTAHFPSQNFQELTEAASLGNWPNVVYIKITKSKLQGHITDLARTRVALFNAQTMVSKLS